MKQLEIMIVNPTGLHARPAKVFVNAAKEFQSDVRVFYNGKKANAKSLISLLTLGVESGNRIRIEITGEDEKEAIQALEEVIQNGLGEEELLKNHAAEVQSHEAPSSPPKPVEDGGDNLSQNRLQGVAGAPGVAVGPVFHFTRKKINIEETFESESEEKDALQKAVEQAKGQLIYLRDKMQSEKANSEAAIFDVHLGLLEDVEILDEVLGKIDRKKSAALAWQTTIESRAKLLAALEDPLLAARAADLHDVGYRVLRILVGADEQPLQLPDHPVIIIADDLAPSDTAALDVKRVLGFCTVQGGPTTHTAIIARSLGLPAVVSVGKMVLSLKESTPIILNGDDGTITINPDEKELDFAKEEKRKADQRRSQAQAAAGEPAITLDGHRVEIAANIGGLDDARKAMESGAEAVGLLRTEFLFLERSDPPTEEEQFQVYRDIAKAMQDQPVIIRTLDVGGDKPLPYIQMDEEANPFLGERGIRLCLAQPELLRQQIRALVRASQFGKLRIMFPMVADLSELLEAREMVSQIEKEMNVSGIEVGIMIEVPSAALMADILAEYVDFFSIGTNDLTQYTLAMDRMNPHLAGKSDGLHPAVLRLIQTTIQAAHQAGKWVGVCGELGADSTAIPILTGMGIDELSVTVPVVPTVKAQVRKLNYQNAQALAKQALQCATAAEVRKLTLEQ